MTHWSLTISFILSHWIGVLVAQCLGANSWLSVNVNINVTAIWGASCQTYYGHFDK